MALAERVEHAKCSAAGRRQLVNTDRGWTTIKHAGANGAHLCLLTFVLRLQCYQLFTPVFVKCRTSIIFEHKHSSRPKNIDALLCKSFVAFAEISNTATLSIREPQCFHNRVGFKSLDRS